MILAAGLGRGLMKQATSNEGESDRRMGKRRTTLEDGRYLIFYAFDEQSMASGSSEAEAETPAPPPEPPSAQLSAEEERHV